MLPAAIAAESTGISVPGEATLVAAAVLAAHGHMDIVLVVALAAAGAALLAQTRQAERDRIDAEAHARHSDLDLEMHSQLLRHNAALTEQVADMAADIDRLSREISDRLAHRGDDRRNP